MYFYPLLSIYIDLINLEVAWKEKCGKDFQIWHWWVSKIIFIFLTKMLR